MALKIRLRQQGRTNQHTYRLIVTDVREPRDGKYIEMLGWYNPSKAENDVLVQADRVSYWLALGAELSESAYHILARGAPEVIREYDAKKHAKRLKAVKARRALKK